MNEFDDVIFFSPGSVIRRSISILMAELPLFLSLTGLVYLPFVALVLLGTLMDTSVMMYSVVAGYIISLICQPLATAALIHGVFRRLRGERASLGDSLQTGLSRFFPVLGFSFLSTLLISIGSLLCIIPGIIMSCVLYVGLPVVVVESQGPIDAIRRSDGLTTGFRWGIFGLLIVVGLTQFALNTGVSFGLSMFGLGFDVTASSMQTTMIISQLITYLSQILTTALSGVFVAVAYHDLRVSRDGIDSDDLISVFD